MRWIRLLATCACTATATLSAVAQPATVPAASAAGDVSLRQAFEAAFERSAPGRAFEARQAEHRARRDAAGSLTPEPPSLAFLHRSDRINSGRGAREDEAELAVPLWMPGTRAAASAVAQAEAQAFEAELLLNRLKIAAEVREAAWSVRLAGNELQAATRRVSEAQALSADVQRRMKAGDLARTDANQAQAAVQQARSLQAESEARMLRARRAYTALTGLAQAPVHTEPVPETWPAIEAHPQWVSALRAVDAARSRLQQVTRDTRDAPELSLTLTRERGDSNERYVTTTGIGVRVPFGTDARNQPRITGANAALIELQATVNLERDHLQAEIEAARSEFQQAQTVEQLSAERARLAADTQQLLAKAFSLGDIDLPTRLRAENERFDADLALGRARLEAGRAASRLLQAYGLLP